MIELIKLSDKKKNALGHCQVVIREEVKGDTTNLNAHSFVGVFYFDKR